jgi:hypothetical protein
VSRVLCAPVLAPTEVLRSFGGQSVTNGRTGQCAGIERMVRVGLRWDTRHGYGSALDERSCAKRECFWTFARVSVRTCAYVCGPGMGHTAGHMGRYWKGELDRRGRRVI